MQKPGAGHAFKDDAGYSAIHMWLRTTYPKSGVCEDCGKVGPTDYANTNGHVYTRDRADYREMCKLCHGRFDGRYAVDSAA